MASDDVQLVSSPCEIYRRVSQTLKKRDVDQVSSLKRQGWLGQAVGSMDQAYLWGRNLTGNDPADFFNKMSVVCTAYKEAQNSYTKEGQKALERVRVILAKGLLNDLQMNPNKTGEALKIAWLASHPAVYQEQGVFDLDGSDKILIGKTALPQLLADSEMRRLAIGGYLFVKWDQFWGNEPGARLIPPYKQASAVYGRSADTRK